MLKLKCTCGKNLAPGEIKCGLCAMGLSPARQVDLPASYQTGVSVRGNEDSGINCPRCLAGLSCSEVAASNCSHCHATVAHKVIPMVQHRPTHFTDREDQLRSTVKLWPEKAPIR
ncbi:MAG: hypothetical protein M3R04_10390 [bacterium]|nr:hypothetical protein [bacterium]